METSKSVRVNCFGAIPPAAMLVQRLLSAADLLGCFDLAAEVRCAAVAGYLRELIVHVLAEEERWQLLRWCTSRSALPATGLSTRRTG